LHFTERKAQPFEAPAARLHREFNVSAAGNWITRMPGRRRSSPVRWSVTIQTTTRRALQQVVDWIESSWPDVQVLDNRIEM